MTVNIMVSFELDPSEAEGMAAFIAVSRPDAKELLSAASTASAMFIAMTVRELAEQRNRLRDTDALDAELKDAFDRIVAVAGEVGPQAIDLAAFMEALTIGGILTQGRVQ